MPTITRLAGRLRFDSLAARVYICPMTDFDDDRNCFVCGPGNGAGLRLVFRPTAEGLNAEAEVVFPAHLQGWKGTCTEDCWPRCWTR